MKKLTTPEAISRFRKVHGDYYDYSEFVHRGNFIKGTVICPIHGRFEIQSGSHARGAGCYFCAKENSRLTIDQVILQFRAVHNDRYIYDKFIYVNDRTKGIIICPEHGEFLQTPNNHKNGSGCPKCGNQRSAGSSILDVEIVLNRFKKTHNNFYSYTYVREDYVNSTIPVRIICPNHGIFKQMPFNHEQGSKCPKCKTNKAEEFLRDIFEKNNISYIYNDRNLIKPLEIDILVPDFNFGIEHNGLVFHSYGESKHRMLNNYIRLDKKQHLEKTIKMEEQGYQLFHIREDHLLNETKKDIWKSILLNKCGFSNKIHARKLQVVNLSNYSDFVTTFLENNHLQGSCSSSIKLGLQDSKTGVIYSIMTFGKSRFNKNIEYELLRFCNAKFFNVRGAASKLLKAFERIYKPQSLISYANRDWSMGNLYSKLGFKYSHTSEPNYIYTNLKREIISRQKVQKHKLKDFLESRNLIFNENLSERDNMINNGYRIYYDTGNLVYCKYYNK